MKNAHNTRHKAFSYLKSIFDYAKKKDTVTGDPFEEVNVKPKYAPREFQQENEVTDLVNLYRSDAYYKESSSLIKPSSSKSDRGGARAVSYLLAGT